MKGFLYGLVAVVALYTGVLYAAPVFMTPGGSATVARPCSHKGINKSDVAATSATTNRSAAMAINQQVMITCDVDVHVVQGPSGATGSTTNGAVLWDHVPYWLLSEEDGQYFAFTKKSGESDGTCYVIECR
jgi:hypothetical protein